MAVPPPPKATGVSLPKFCTACGSTLRNRFGQEVHELFDAELFQKSKILKLRDCQNCLKVADKYVEQDGVLILVDLILQTKSAYRHVLLNGSYEKLILKMVLLAVICDGYIAWAAHEGAGEFFEQEYQFYVACLKVFVGLTAFLGIALLSVLFRSFRTSLLGLLLAYSSRFANLAALFWSSDKEGREGQIMWAFNYFMFFVATTRVLQVSQNHSLLSSLAVAILAHAGFNLLTHFDFLLQPIPCV